MEARSLETEGSVMRVLSNVLSGLTLFVGVVIPLANIRDLSVWTIVPILFAIPIAYLLYCPDEFHSRHRTLITSIGTAALALGLGAVGYFIALCFNPSLNPDLTHGLGAAIVLLAVIVVSLLLLADGAVLLVREQGVSRNPQ